MKKDENTKPENKEEEKNSIILDNISDENYSKYIINDSDFFSQSSNDDIETKMNKIINIIKNGGNIHNIISNNNNKDEINKSQQTLKNENKKEIQIKNNENIIKEEYNKEKKDEPIKEKKNHEENIQINQTNNISNINNINPFEKNIKNEKMSKITLKKKEIELLKKKEENYININNSLSDIKKAEIRNIEKQINKQKIKNQNIGEGINVSGTDSKIEYELNPEMKLENGLAYIVHLVENHIILLKLEFFKSLFNLKKKKILKFLL